MSEDAIIYAKDLIRLMASGMALFIAWWIGHYILPLNEKQETATQRIIILEERDRHASEHRKRLELEINKLRGLNIKPVTGL